MREVNAVDFWRGYALLAIFINHIPNNFYERFTYKNISLSDSAELFVFLAGWSLRLMVGRPEDPRPTPEILFRVLGRAVTLYVAQMAIALIAIAMLAAAALHLANPLFLEWHNAAAVFYDPVRAHIGLVLLSHQLGYFDILPLYVVLMLVFAPVVAILHRTLPAFLLPLSALIYLSALVFKITVPTWPTQGQWFFNPLCWQFVFVLGFWMSRERGPGGWVRANVDRIRLIALPIVIGGALAVLMRWWPDPTKMPEPKLLFIAGKTFVTPLRLGHFLALVVVFSAVFPLLTRTIPSIVTFLSLLGRNSLNVFCFGSLLSLGAQILHFVFGRGLVIDTLLVVSGILIMGVTAWLSEWRERGRS